MVLFPLLDVIDLIMDGIFYDKVKSNSNNALSNEDAKDYKAIILTFFCRRNHGYIDQHRIIHRNSHSPKKHRVQR